jgi:hypothetical protein
MLRLSKVATLCLALTAIIALAPASAFARGGSHGAGGHFGHFHGAGASLGFGFYAYYGYDPGCLWVRRTVHTWHGLRWRRVPVCD